MSYAPDRLSLCCSRAVNPDAAHRCSGCGEPLGSVYCAACEQDITPPGAAHVCGPVPLTTESTRSLA